MTMEETTWIPVTWVAATGLEEVEEIFEDAAVGLDQGPVEGTAVGRSGAQGGSSGHGTCRMPPGTATSKTSRSSRHYCGNFPRRCFPAPPNAIVFQVPEQWRV